MFHALYLIDSDCDKRIIKLLKPYNTLRLCKSEIISANETNYVALMTHPYEPNYTSLQSREDDAECVLCLIKFMWMYKDLLKLHLNQFKALRIALDSETFSKDLVNLSVTIRTSPYLEQNDADLFNTTYAMYTRSYLTAVEAHANTLKGHDRAVYLLRYLPCPRISSYWQSLLLFKLFGCSMGLHVLQQEAYFINNICINVNSSKSITVDIPYELFEQPDFIPERILYCMIHTKLAKQYSVNLQASHNPLISKMCIFTFFFTNPFLITCYPTTDCISITLQHNNIIKPYTFNRLILPVYYNLLRINFDSNEAPYDLIECRDRIFELFVAFLKYCKWDTTIYWTVCMLTFQFVYTVENIMLVEHLLQLLYNAFTSRFLFVTHVGHLVFNRNQMNTIFNSAHEKHLFQKRYFIHPLYAILTLRKTLTMFNDSAEIIDIRNNNICISSFNAISMFGATGTVTSRIINARIIQPVSIMKQILINVIYPEPMYTKQFCQTFYVFDHHNPQSVLCGRHSLHPLSFKHYILRLNYRRFMTDFNTPFTATKPYVKLPRLIGCNYLFSDVRNINWLETLNSELNLFTIHLTTDYHTDICKAAEFDTNLFYEILILYKEYNPAYAHVLYTLLSQSHAGRWLLNLYNYTIV